MWGGSQAFGGPSAHKALHRDHTRSAQNISAFGVSSSRYTPLASSVASTAQGYSGERSRSQPGLTALQSGERFSDAFDEIGTDSYPQIRSQQTLRTIRTDCGPLQAAHLVTFLHRQNLSTTSSIYSSSTSAVNIPSSHVQRSARSSEGLSREITSSSRQSQLFQRGESAVTPLWEIH